MDISYISGCNVYYSGLRNRIGDNIMDKVQKYVEIRIEQLEEELEKNSSNGNDLILGKAIAELSEVLQLIKRERLLQINPYSTGFN